MKPWQTYLLSAAVILTLAALNAVTGIHEATGNRGFLGTEFAGVFGDTLERTGVLGMSGSGNGVGGIAEGGTGVYGESAYSAIVGTATGGAILGISPVGVSGNGFSGVRGATNSTFGAGVEGLDYRPPGGLGGGLAGWFRGNVTVTGTLSKAAGEFRIDHPLDPANKYLVHSFVESSEMKNIYDGVIELDDRGEAVVELPAWFEALNNDFRYQLTCIGRHAPVYIAAEIRQGRFRIAGGSAGMRVSWQVTGIRHDPYAEAHPLRVEEAKPPREKGRYLHPELHGRPRSEAINSERETHAVSPVSRPALRRDVPDGGL